MFFTLGRQPVSLFAGWLAPAGPFYQGYSRVGSKSAGRFGRDHLTRSDPTRPDPTREG